MKSLIGRIRQFKRWDGEDKGPAHSTRRFEFPLPAYVVLHPKTTTSISEGYYHGFTLIICLETAADVTIDDLAFRLSPGDCILASPFQSYRIEHFGSDSATWLLVTFETGKPLHLISLKNRVVDLDKSTMNCISSLCEESDTPAKNKQLHAETLTIMMSHFLALLVRKTEQYADSASVAITPSTPHGQLIKNISDYLYAHMHETIGVKDLARHFSISESHLRNVFRRQINVGPGTFIRGLKMLHAKRLLEATDMTVTRITYACGFDSLYSFSRGFKTHTGLSPLQYRHKTRPDALTKSR